MNRTVDIDIGGVTYPLCLTLGAFTAIGERYGDLPSCLKRMDELVQEKDNLGLVDELVWLLSELMKGARQQKRLSEPESCGFNALTEADLKALLCPGDIPYVQLQVLTAISVGQSREVAVQAPKNAEGAGEGSPVPEY